MELIKERLVLHDFLDIKAPKRFVGLELRLDGLRDRFFLLGPRIIEERAVFL